MKEGREIGHRCGKAHLADEWSAKGERKEERNERRKSRGGKMNAQAAKQIGIY